MERLVSFVHTVEQGDHMAKIADEYGFSDYHTIWDLPDNADLRAKRSDPSLLMPGDQITIPDKQQKQVPVATGGAHEFTLKGQRLKLRILVCDFLGKPQKNADCQLTVEGATVAAKTDGDGFLDVALEPSAEQAKLPSSTRSRSATWIRPKSVRAGSRACATSATSPSPTTPTSTTTRSPLPCSAFNAIRSCPSTASSRRSPPS